MRSFIISIIILFIRFLAYSQVGIDIHTPQNPILPPQWDLHIADAEAKVFDNRIYVYGSNDDPYRFGFCSDVYHVISTEDQYYLFYHNLIPDRPHTRDMWIEPLKFNEDGTISKAELSSSGVRGSFVAGDRIQAASACIFPNKGNVPQHISRKEQYAMYSFNAIQSCIGFRYMDFSSIEGGKIHLNLKSDYGGVLEVTGGMEGYYCSSIKKWRKR